VQVIDLLGTVVYESDGVSDKIFKKEIDLTEEAGGIYFVKVKSGDEYCIRKLRLVK
jgi:hypothetical protein